MNVARVSDSGQIVVPIAIRQALKVKSGDKLLFFKKESGEIVINNVSASAIEEAQDAVAGYAYSEDEVLADIMAMRYREQSA